MELQFYKSEIGGKHLVKDGDPVTLAASDQLEYPSTGYIKAERVHSVKYVEDCRLVYLHNGDFGFADKSQSAW